MSASMQRMVRDASPETRYQIERLLRQDADDRSQVVSTIWPITLCSAAFLATQPVVSRANAWHDIESSRQKARSS